MGRLNRWVKVGIVIIVASLSLGTATIGASASMGTDTPQAQLHVH